MFLFDRPSKVTVILTTLRNRKVFLLESDMQHKIPKLNYSINYPLLFPLNNFFQLGCQPIACPSFCIEVSDIL